MKVLGTGLNGLVGSRIVELLNTSFEFENISRATGIDITSFKEVNEKVSSTDASLVLHMAAKTNVDSCEEDKTKGEDGEAWKINVEGTRNIVQACEASNKKLIYVSTDFVFDGTKNEHESYTEEDTPHPINWYARTKYEGEKIVQESIIPWIIARISYPYRANFEKKDFVRAILSRMQETRKIKAVSDHVFCPTFIDDIAHALRLLIKKDEKGIFHVTGGSALTPFDASIKIARVWGINAQIDPLTRDEFFQGKAPRPFNLSCKNDKITHLNVKMKTFEEGLQEIKYQISKIKDTDKI